MKSARGEGFEEGWRSGPRWFVLGLMWFLAVAALLAIFAGIRGGKQWLEANLEEAEGVSPALTRVVRVTLSGEEVVDIDPSALPGIVSQTDDWLRQRRAYAREHVLVHLGRELDEVFERVEGQVPGFADWYYSLSGEYGRLGHALLGNLPEFMARRLDRLVFAPAGTAAAVDALEGEMERLIVEELRLAGTGLRDTLASLIRARQVTETQGVVSPVAHWSLSEKLARGFDSIPVATPVDVARQGVATTAGAATAALAVKKLGAASVAKASVAMAGHASLASVGPIAAKLGLKSAAKAGGVAGSAGAGAASAAALCAGSIAGAPLAPGCAVVGGAVTGLAVWVLSDKLLLESEELLRREEFEAQLRDAITTERVQLKADLARHCETMLGSGFDQWQEQFDALLPTIAAHPVKDFVPARAAAGN